MMQYVRFEQFWQFLIVQFTHIFEAGIRNCPGLHVKQVEALPEHVGQD